VALERIYNARTGPGLAGPINGLMQVLRTPLVRVIPAHDNQPARRVVNYVKLGAAACSIAWVGLALYLTWRLNTTESDPSELTGLLLAA
jgi:hypothetical protein